MRASLASPGDGQPGEGVDTVQKGRMYELQLIQPRLSFPFSFPPQ